MQSDQKNPVLYRRAGRLAVVSLDNPPVNALGHAVRGGLLAALDAAEADAEVDALVIRGTPRVFSAGADIAEFSAPPRAPHLSDLNGRTAAASKPTVAVIDGVALGGGLELALACRYRLARANARLGLPEVKLGLIPGAGGTVRLPALVGLVPALRIIGEGEAITAAEAFELGLIDGVIADGVDAIQATKALLSNPPHRAANQASGDVTAFEAAAAAFLKKRKGQAAPAAVVTALRNAATLSPAQAIEEERHAFSTLRTGPESAALRHLFFAERAAARAAQPASPAHSIEIVGVIGAGTMGRGIAMALANAGLAVRLCDVDPQALGRGLEAIGQAYVSATARGTLSAGAASRFGAAIQPRTAVADLSDCDLVIEAAFEDLAVKQSIFAELDAVMPADAILASNTSYLDIDVIAAATRRPGSVLGLHFFSPAHVMKLVEIVRGAATRSEVIDAALALAKRLGKVPVVVGVCPGFVGNRMLGARNAELSELLLAGATPMQVDAAFTDFGWAMGPFAMQDMAGLDISWRNRRANGQVLAIADELCAAGRFGQKTGAGYYRYDAGSRTPIPDPEVAALIASLAEDKGIARRPVRDAQIIEHTLYPLINEGFHILDEGIAARAADVDLVWVHGYGFPRSLGGPLHWARQQDLSAMVAALSAMHEQSGKAIFRPAKGLVAMAHSQTSQENFG